jgi:hypothetical protein
MLTGTPPFERGGSVESAYAILHDAPPSLRDPELSRVTGRCLSKSPARRYPTGAELHADRRRLARGKPVRGGWIVRQGARVVFLAAVRGRGRCHHPALPVRLPDVRKFRMI